MPCGSTGHRASTALSTMLCGIPPSPSPISFNASRMKGRRLPSEPRFASSTRATQSPRMHTFLRSIGFALLLSACPVALRSQVAESASAQAKVAYAVRVNRAPRLDGTINDALWNSAKPITDFFQREPYEGQTPTERTEVRVLYTRDTEPAHAHLPTLDRIRPAP